MNVSAEEYLKCRAELSASRMRNVVRDLPNKLEDEPANFVRSHPLGSLAGTFAIAALITRSLVPPSQSKNCAAASVNTDDAKSAIAEGSFLGALTAPIVSFASSQLLKYLLRDVLPESDRFDEPVEKSEHDHESEEAAG